MTNILKELAEAYMHYFRSQSQVDYSQLLDAWNALDVATKKGVVDAAQDILEVSKYEIQSASFKVNDAHGPATVKDVDFFKPFETR
jgi:hypothetical protein